MLALCSDLCARVPGGAPAPRRLGPAPLPGGGRGSGRVRSEGGRGGAPRPPRPPPLAADAAASVAAVPVAPNAARFPPAPRPCTRSALAAASAAASADASSTLDAATAVAPARGAWYTRPFSIQKVFFGEFSFPFSVTRPTDGDPEPAELHTEPPYVPAPKTPFADRRLFFFSFSYVSPASAATPAS